MRLLRAAGGGCRRQAHSGRRLLPDPAACDPGSPPWPLPSRSVGRCKRVFAELCVKAVLSVADLERKDVNLDLIKVGRAEGLPAFVVAFLLPFFPLLPFLISLSSSDTLPRAREPARTLPCACAPCRWVPR